jgi:hypothetical protein
LGSATLTAKERMAAAKLHRNGIAIVFECALLKNGFCEKSHVSGSGLAWQSKRRDVD